MNDARADNWRLHGHAHRHKNTFKTEWEPLELTDHQWAPDDVEE